MTMLQPSLFQNWETERIVNVASVPQRSPFRYPGGKTWLVPRIRQWLCCLPEKPRELFEPFAGGGSVSLAAAFENLTDRVTMAELDAQVAAVWQAVLGGDGGAELSKCIAEFVMNEENARHIMAGDDNSTIARAFRTIVKNRVSHGGILAHGSGLLKQGENGKGVASRWYPETLCKRIHDIGLRRERVVFVHGDGMELLRRNAHRTDAVFFLDPPYTAGGKRAGQRLYTHHELNHEELFRLAANLHGDFLLTYDNTAEMRDRARQHGFAFAPVAMKNTHHAPMTELLIGRNLDWLRPTP